MVLLTILMLKKVSYHTQWWSRLITQAWHTRQWKVRGGTLRLHTEQAKSVSSSILAGTTKFCSALLRTCGSQHARWNLHTRMDLRMLCTAHQ